MKQNRRPEDIWDEFLAVQQSPTTDHTAVGRAIRIIAECDAISRADCPLLERHNLRDWIVTMQLWLASRCDSLSAYSIALALVRDIVAVEPSRFEAWELLVRMLQIVDPQQIPASLDGCPTDFFERREFEFAQFLVDVNHSLDDGISRWNPDLMALAQQALTNR